MAKLEAIIVTCKGYERAVHMCVQHGAESRPEKLAAARLECAKCKRICEKWGRGECGWGLCLCEEVPCG